MAFFRGTGDVDSSELASSIVLSADLAAAGGAALVGFTPTGTIASTNVQAAIAEINTDLAASGGAALLGFDPTGTIASTTVQTAIAEAASEALQKASNLSDLASVVTARSNLGLTAITGAGLIGYTPTGTVASNTVQAAIDEVVSDLAASSGSTLIGFLQSGTGATAITVWNALKKEVIIEMYGGGTAASAATNTTAITNSIAYLNTIGGGDLILPPGNYNANVFTVAYANVKIRGYGYENTSLTFATVGANIGAISVNADNFKIDGVKLIGPSVGVFVVNENAIQTNGTFAAVRTGFAVTNCEIYNFGSYGISAEYTNNTNINKNYIHNVGYGAVFFRSCITGWIQKNRISTITPGSASNMYGISVSHTSTAPFAAKADANHFSYGINIIDNEIEDINWEAIDAHGGYEIVVGRNKIYNTKNGIAVSSSSGSALNYAGNQNIVSNNIVDSRKKDGTAGSYSNNGHGINLNGYSTANTQNQTKVICTGNIIHGKGIVNSNNTGSIMAEGTEHVNISDNIITSWAGSGILLGNQTTGTVAQNILGHCFANNASDSIKRCIEWRTGAGEISLVGNSHRPQGGESARYGFYTGTLTVITRDGVYLAFSSHGNDFSQASVLPFSLIAGSSRVSSDIGTVLYHSQLIAAGAKQINIGNIASNLVHVLVSGDAPLTISGITGHGNPFGQMVVIQNIGANALTVSRAYSLLSGGVDQAIPNNSDCITLMKGSSDVDWIQTSPVMLNS